MSDDPDLQAGSLGIDILKADPAEAARLASRPGGVRVLDADGNECFRLCIPGASLDDTIVLDESVITTLLDRNDTLTARLRSLLALVTRSIGHCTPEDQLVIQEARAALGEAVVSPERQVVIEEWLGKRGGK